MIFWNVSATEGRNDLGAVNGLHWTLPSACIGILRSAHGLKCAKSQGDRTEIMSRDPTNAGALSFMRTGDPSLGSFADATILKKFGDVPDNLDEL